MRIFLLVAQIAVSILLILVILSQEKGVAAGGTFGGSGQVFRGRRGVDRLLLWLTIVLAVLFVAISIGFIFVPRDSGPSGTSGGTLETSSVKVEGTDGLKVETIPLDTKAE